MNIKISFIGAGNIGGALIEGFLSSGKISPSSISVSDRNTETLDKFREMGVNIFENNADCTRGADMVIVAVKPYLVDVVASDIKGAAGPSTLIVSVAAGVSLGVLEAEFGRRCFRAIPNIAASLGQSMTFISHNSFGDEDVDKVRRVFDMAGRSLVIDEKLLDAAMVSASCGTAFALRYLRAAMEGSIEMGLTAAMSRTVVAQTVKGACDMLLEGDLHPEALIDMVSTPGGITIAGLNEMEHNGFTSSVINGHNAAYKKVKG